MVGVYAFESLAPPLKCRRAFLSVDEYPMYKEVLYDHRVGAGSVVVVSSLAGKLGLPRSPIYSVSRLFHILHTSFTTIYFLNKIR